MSEILVSKEVAHLLMMCRICGTPVTKEDFRKTLAIRYGNKPICASCARGIVRAYMIKKKLLGRRFKR